MKGYIVTKEIFEEYIKINNLKRTHGPIYNSLSYINKNNNVMAKEDSSSWSNKVSYKIYDELYSNIETIVFVSNLFNSNNI